MAKVIYELNGERFETQVSSIKLVKIKGEVIKQSGRVISITSKGGNITLK